jgi:DNA repair protein RadC
MAVPDSYQTTIKEMPASERPRERLQAYGPRALSSGELIAILLRTGIKGTSAINFAVQMLSQFGGLGGLARCSFEELTAIKGLGPAKVAQLQAALELGRRMMVEAPEDRPQIRCPADAANLMMSELMLLEQEHLCTMLLDTKNHVLAKKTVYVGSLNTSLIRVGELFREAIRASAASIIVVHNHPSGAPRSA